MNDEDLFGLNIYCEAGMEPMEGKAAIARVVLNRMARRFQSDGTVEGTILHNAAFSWAWFEFNDQHKYVRVCYTLDEARARAAKLLARINPKLIAPSREVGIAVRAGAYSGPLFDQLGDAALLYLNPKIAKPQPWSVPDKFLVTIGRHDFFRA